MIGINPENYLSGVVSRDKEKYCSALEDAGIYNACEENLSGLLELLDPFFELLNRKFWLDGKGLISTVLPKNPEEKTLYQGLFRMNLVSNEGNSYSLKKDGYDLIPLYRKRKNLPTRQEERNKITDKLIAYSEKLGW